MRWCHGRFRRACELMRVTLLVGTKRGLFTFTSDVYRCECKFSGPYLVGTELYHAIDDPRDQTIWAATDHSVWGANLHTSSDFGETWTTLENAPHYRDRALNAIWYLA